MGNKNDTLNSWKWNELEDAALDELHDAYAEKLYLRGLRKHMDYGTSYVGIKRRVSYQMFCELLEELPSGGSHRQKFKPTKDTIRWLLSRLENVGLIKKIKQSNRRASMVFKLPLASTALIRPGEEHHRSTIRGAPQPKPSVSKLDDYRNTIGAPYEEPHTSGSPVNSLPHTKKNILDAAWCRREWHDIAIKQFRPELLSRADFIVIKFEEHYRANLDITSTDWDAMFMKWIVDEREK